MKLVPQTSVKFFKRTLLAGTVLALVALPLSATAFMRTIDNSQILNLERLTGTNFMEHYAHPDIEDYGFGGIYFEPVTSSVTDLRIYEQDLRPAQIDALAEEFHAKLLARFERSGLLVDTPDENTLVISTALTDVERFTADFTGTHLADAPPDNRDRGGAVMEMVWRAGVGGDIVLALRDARQPEIYHPVTDQNDRLTDVHDAFDTWTEEMAYFFALDDEIPTN